MRMNRSRRFIWGVCTPLAVVMALIFLVNIAASYINRHRDISVIEIAEFTSDALDASQPIAADNGESQNSSNEIVLDSPQGLAHILNDNKDYRVLISDTITALKAGTYAATLPAIDIAPLVTPVSMLNFENWDNHFNELVCSYATASPRRMRVSVLKCLMVLYVVHVYEPNAQPDPLNAFLGLLGSLGEEPTADSFYCVSIGVEIFADLLQDGTFSAAMPSSDAVKIMRCLQPLMENDYSVNVRTLDAALLHSIWYDRKLLWNNCESELFSNTLFATTAPTWISPFGRWAVLEVMTQENPHWFVALSPVARAVRSQLEIVTSREPLLYSDCNRARKICEQKSLLPN